MAKAYINFAINNTNNPGAPWSNEFFGAGTYDTIGVLSADLLDDAGASTGWGLQVTDVFDNDSGSTTNATADSVWPQEIFDYYWQTENGGTGAFLITGLPSGESYTIELAGHTLNAGRHTEFTVNGVSADYTTSASAAAPAAPITFNGTVPGNGEIAITVDMAATGQFYGYVNGLTIETTAGGGRSITDIDTDDTVQVGQTNVNITTVGLDASPSTQIATLGGETLTINSWSETLVNVDIPTNIDLRWGRSDLALALTDDTGTVTLSNVTLSNRTGWATVTVSALHAATNEFGDPIESYRTAAADTIPYTVVVGDQLQYTTHPDMTVDTETIVQIDPPQDVMSLYAFFNDGTGRTIEAGILWNDVDGDPVIPTGGTRASNEEMIAFFRAATGLNSYSFNELAIAYYKQTGSTALPQFNDSMKAAQDAVPFVGLAPVDWRNFL